MTEFILFPSFIDALCRKNHDLAADQFALALSNDKPPTAAATLTDIKEIEYTSLSSRVLKHADITQKPGSFTTGFDDLVLTALADVPEFQYFIVYNTSNKAVVGYYQRQVANFEKGDEVRCGFNGKDGLFSLGGQPK